MEEEHVYEFPNSEGAISLKKNPFYEEFEPKSVTVSTSKSKWKKPIYSWLCMCALVGFILVGSAAFASLALTVWNSSQVNHRLQNTISGLENSVNGSISECKSIIKQLQNSLNDSASELERILQIQNSLNDCIELYSLLGRNSINPASSCSHVLLFNLSSPSSHYWIRSSNGSAVRVYCEFNRQCGCDGPSAWTRVAFLNMSDPNQVCPSKWTTISTPVRTCGKVERQLRLTSSFYSSVAPPLTAPLTLSSWIGVRIVSLCSYLCL